MSKKKEIQNFKNKIIKITSSTKIIPEIHNYCDRWCEKCAYTKHCAVFIMEQEENNAEINDINNEKFWDKLSLIFAATFDMIAEDIKKSGIDLNEIKGKPINHKINKTEIEQRATKYGIEITNWLDDNADLLKQKAQQLNIINDKKLISLTDAIEIIQWYSFFKYVKHYEFIRELINKFNGDIYQKTLFDY